MMIHSKKDAIKAVRALESEGTDHEEINCITWVETEGVMNNFTHTEIRKDAEGNLFIFSFGKNWVDQGRSYISEKRAIEMVYKNRKLINKYQKLDYKY